jgi:lysylphosphatidylglycerol synthetase-like protein (DUF2156 family)
LVGLLLITLSWSLFRRKQQGWIAAVILLCLSVILHLLKGLDYEEATSAFLVLCILLGTRHYFVVRSDSRAFGNAIVFGVIALIGCMAYGVAGFALLHKHFTPAFTFGRALWSTFALVLPVDHPILVPVWHLRHGLLRPDREALWFINSLVAVTIGSALYIAGALIRPVAAALHAAEHEREEAKQILERSGGTPLAYWTLMPRLTYLFSQDRTAFLAYRVVDSVAIVLGDPQGDAAGFPELLETFAHLCLQNDWRPAWYR